MIPATLSGRTLAVGLWLGQTSLLGVNKYILNYFNEVFKRVIIIVFFIWKYIKIFFKIYY